MRLPSASAYTEALQDSSTCFADPELAAAIPVLGPLGLPRAISGNVATVFRLDGADGRSWAVRCFVRPVADERGRYEAVAAHLGVLSSSWRVPFELQPCGVRVEGDWWPIVKMAWAPGSSLLPWVERHLWDPGALAYLAVRFAGLADQLRADEVAHGDLQHGNVLVAPGGDLRLVDYDGMWVPALAGHRGAERGHRSYQHPGRQGADFGPGLDNFSSWVVYASLAALAADPLLWSRLDGGEEALLLREHDLAEPDRSAAFAAFESSEGPGVPELGKLLRRFLGSDPADVPPLSPTTAPVPRPALAGPSPGAPGPGAAADQHGTLSVALGGPSAVERPGAVATLAARRPAGSEEHGTAGGAAAVRPGGPPHAARRAGGRGVPEPFGDSLAAGRHTVAVGVAAVLVCVVGGVGTIPLLTLAGVVAAAAATWVRLGRLYQATPEACATRRLDDASAAPRRAAAEADAVVGRLAADREALAAAEEAAEEEAETARAARRRRDVDALAAVDAVLDAELAAVAEQEREVHRAERDARAAALAELQRQVIDDQLGHHSLVASAAVDEKVVHRLALDGVRTAADFTAAEVERGGGVVVVRRDGRRLVVGGMEPRQATALTTWRRRMAEAGQLKVPSALPPSRVAAIRADHDRRRAVLAAEAEATREAARQRAAAIRARTEGDDAEVATRVAAVAVEAAGRRVAFDRRLVSARKAAAEAHWRLGEHERAHGPPAAPADFATYVRRVVGLPPARTNGTSRTAT